MVLLTYIIQSLTWITPINDYIIKNLYQDVIVHWLERSGSLALKLGSFEEAGNYYRRLLVNYSNSEKAKDALFWIGESEYFAGRITEARERFQRYLETFPNGTYQKTVIYRLSRISIAAGELDEAHNYLKLLKQNLSNSHGTGEIVGSETDVIALSILEGDIFAEQNSVWASTDTQP